MNYHVTISDDRDGIYLVAKNERRFLRGRASKACATLIKTLQGKAVPDRGLVLVAHTPNIEAGLQQACEALGYGCEVVLLDRPAPSPRPGPRPAPRPVEDSDECPKCLGAGGGVHVTWFQYDGGDCFLCHGTGVNPRASRRNRTAHARARAQAYA